VSPDWTQTGVVAVALLIGAATVVLHYEGLRWMARHFGNSRDPIRRHVMLAIIFGLVALHVTEIGLFGVSLWAVLHLPGSGSIAGAHPVGIFDAMYLSAVTYTTVGFGDLAPVGKIRFIAATEALLGLMMITWSASFTYLEMSRHWRRR